MTNVQTYRYTLEILKLEVITKSLDIEYRILDIPLLISNNQWPITKLTVMPWSINHIKNLTET